MKKITVSEFLNEDYKKYAMYVLESRAIASCIDGLKTVNRKILYVAEKTARKEKCKVNVLSGSVIAGSQYHHGNVSCEDGIVKMAQKFKNSIPLLEDIGMFGSLRNPYAASSRYISTKLSAIFDFIFKDEFLLEHNEIDGFICEPKHFLPIIPMLLVNGSNGIAVGFASNILSRDPINIIESCINLLNNKKYVIKEPKICEFSGKFIRNTDNDKKWEIYGKYEIINNDIHIHELVPSMTYEKYEALLDKLCDDNIIKSYKNVGKGEIHYIIKADNSFLNESNILKKLKLVEYETENFTTLDEHGKLKIFNSPEEILNYFVNFRLTYYVKRKEFNLNKLRDELKVLANKGKFIKAILDNKLEIKNKPKNIIIESIINLKLDQIDDSYDYLLRMPIYSLTQELFEKLKLDYTAKKEEIVVLENTEPKTMYLNDLNTLKKNLK